ncbi:MAG TPA: hypothetical protein DCP69_00355 [Candidatus Omnitrophica bacterium]|nr:hypothetical protein [Candidatus Omnitrophota bacterium]
MTDVGGFPPGKIDTSEYDEVPPSPLYLAGERRCAFGNPAWLFGDFVMLMATIVVVACIVAFALWALA